MKRIIDYEILKFNSHKDLQEEVMIRLQYKWQPLGSPFCTTYGIGGSYIEFFQAIVRYEDS